MLAIKDNGAQQSFSERHARLPTENSLDEAGIGVVVPDVDAAAVFWKSPDCDLPPPFDLDEERSQVLQRNGLLTGKVEDLAIGVVRKRSE